MHVKRLVQMQKEQLADGLAAILAERTGVELQIMVSTFVSTHHSPCLYMVYLCR